MKTVILSTNKHHDYFPYLEYTQKAWNKLGWNTFTFYMGDESIESNEQNRVFNISPVEGYRDVTVLQCYRLLGHRFINEGQIMTSDVDMIPLSNYWIKSDKIHCYGSDLTGGKQYPMCYISASKENWDKIIPEQTMVELLDKYPCAKSNDFNEYWYTDQVIATERIKPFNPILVKRGHRQGIANGRIDRATWEQSIKMWQGRYIDAHMTKGFDKEKTEQIMGLIKL